MPVYVSFAWSRKIGKSVIVLIRKNLLKNIQDIRYISERLDLRLDLRIYVIEVEDLSSRDVTFLAVSRQSTILLPR